MRKFLLIFTIGLFLTKISFGQKSDFKRLNRTEQIIINDLSSTFKDTSISFLLSPFINNSIDIDQLIINDLTLKYGFNKNDFNRNTKDTLLLEKCDYFKIINPDSLINWRKIDSKDSFIDPILKNIKKYYRKQGICSIYKILFSKDRKYTLVEYWMNCGFLCGFGETVLMKKDNNRWIKLESLVICES